MQRGPREHCPRCLGRHGFQRQAVAAAVNDVAVLPLHFQVVRWAARNGIIYVAGIDERILAHQFR